MKSTMKYFAAGLAVALAGPGFADPPAYHNLRFEEDWSAAHSEVAEGFFEEIKRIDLSDNIRLSLGGSARLRLEGWDNFGFASGNDDTFLLYRGFFHTDWHFGAHWRVFVQGRYSNLTGRNLPGGKRDVLDVDRGDLWNTFIEAKYGSGVEYMARAGRQELQYGAQRLISPLDWSNNRRIFDAALFRATTERWQVDAFVSSPVIIDGDDFTFNDTDHRQLFSGVYATHKLGDRGHALDVYALWLNDVENRPVEESRFTVGGRAYGPVVDNLSFEIEGAYQFGSRDVRGSVSDAHRDIRAWMLTAEATYAFADLSWKPWITLGADYASGDDDPNDDETNTFDHLFPLGHAYLGFIDTVGRQNIIDARITVGAWPIPTKLRVKADLHAFRLADEDDGLYNAGGALIRPALVTTPSGRTINTGKTEVGQEIDLTVLYKFSPRLNLLAGYSHFIPGDFISATGADQDIDFGYTQIEFTF